MREHTKSYVTERTHKLDTVLRSIYAVRHSLCTKEAFYKDEIATIYCVYFAMTKRTRLPMHARNDKILKIEKLFCCFVCAKRTRRNNIDI